MRIVSDNQIRSGFRSGLNTSAPISLPKKETSPSRRFLDTGFSDICLPSPPPFRVRLTKHLHVRTGSTIRRRYSLRLYRHIGR